MPIAKSQFIIGEDLKAATSEVCLLLGVENETKPRIVDEFEGFEFVVNRYMLGEVVSVADTA